LIFSNVSLLFLAIPIIVLWVSFGVVIIILSVCFFRIRGQACVIVVIGVLGIGRVWVANIFMRGWGQSCVIAFLRKGPQKHNNTRLTP
jgi:hypothetical protein